MGILLTVFKKQKKKNLRNILRFFNENWNLSLKDDVDDDGLQKNRIFLETIKFL